ncbi:MAG: 5'-methylthioadenosine/S-adenosylhomocysteine nucleosidase, partial [Bacteroidota bacterium]
AYQATKALLEEDDEPEVRKKFGITAPKVVLGDIACGDQFIGSHEAVDQLATDIPSLQCVEMEGAAVAQVCYEYEIPFAVIRSISDNANDDAHVDFMAFIEEVANHYSVEIVKRMLA